MGRAKNALPTGFKRLAVHEGTARARSWHGGGTVTGTVAAPLARY